MARSKSPTETGLTRWSANRPPANALGHLPIPRPSPRECRCAWAPSARGSTARARNRLYGACRYRATRYEADIRQRCRLLSSGLLLLRGVPERTDELREYESGVLDIVDDQYSKRHGAQFTPRTRRIPDSFVSGRNVRRAPEALMQRRLKFQSRDEGYKTDKRRYLASGARVRLDRSPSASVRRVAGRPRCVVERQSGDAAGEIRKDDRTRCLAPAAPLVRAPLQRVSTPRCPLCGRCNVFSRGFVFRRAVPLLRYL